MDFYEIDSDEGEAHFLSLPKTRDKTARAERQLIPQKSYSKYLNAYNKFREWQQENGSPPLSEDVMLTYFSEQSRIWKPSTLWAQYSMIRAMLNVNEQIDISAYKQLCAFLKKTGQGFQAKKAKDFTPEEIKRFLTEAPDIIYLCTKVIAIFGVTGACRSGEYPDILWEHVQPKGDIYLVEIPKTENCIPRSFTITNEMMEIVKKYAALRPVNVKINRFFLNYQRGKCSIQPIGINKFRKTPQIIAKYLQLENPDLYTVHSFRRTSATLLADALKRPGIWDNIVSGPDLETPCTVEQALADAAACSKSLEDQLSKRIKLDICQSEDGVGQTSSEQFGFESMPIKDEPNPLSNDTPSPTTEYDPPTTEDPGNQYPINSLDFMSRVLLEQNKKEYHDIPTLLIDIRVLDATINRLNAHRNHLTNLMGELYNNQNKSQNDADKQTGTPDQVHTKESDKEITINIKREVEEVDTEMENAECEIGPVSLAPEENTVVLQNAGEQLILGTNLGNIFYAKVEDEISFHRTIKVADCIITAIHLVNIPDLEMYMFVGAFDSVLRLYSFQSGKLLDSIPLEAPARCMDSMWDFVFIGCSNGIYCRLSQKKGKMEFVEMSSREDVLALKATQEGPRQVLIVAQRKLPILIRDAFSGLLLRQFANAVAQNVYSIALDGGRFYCGTAHNGILKYTFHVSHLEEVLQTGTKAGVSCLKIVRNKLFAGCFDGHVYVIVLNTGNIHILKGRGGNITCMEVVNDKIIVGTLTGSMDSIPIPPDIMLEE